MQGAAADSHLVGRVRSPEVGDQRFSGLVMQLFDRGRCDRDRHVFGVGLEVAAAIDLEAEDNLAHVDITISAILCPMWLSRACRWIRTRSPENTAVVALRLGRIAPAAIACALALRIVSPGLGLLMCS